MYETFYIHGLVGMTEGQLVRTTLTSWPVVISDKANAQSSFKVTIFPVMQKTSFLTFRPIRHCVLSDRTQRRAFSRPISEKMKTIPWVNRSRNLHVNGELFHCATMAYIKYTYIFQRNNYIKLYLIMTEIILLYNITCEIEIRLNHWLWVLY